MKLAFRILTAVVLVSGITLTVGNGLSYTQAQLSEKGALLTTLSTDDTVHPAAIVPMYEQANAGLEMVIGVLLIVLGFFLHGLLMVREERAVHITVVPRSKKRSQPARWFWVEMRI